ncbi:acetyltransferase [Snodgrassella alvi]|uniref:Acetyltransferase n=1 Tax=Snodgrassella alvi TaxID=1196083 RepID=A0A2N9WU09_9NEIS|nr:N-acetyltransferase [Snodgrassella alvi]PIT15424.1 acetyltransferase [Snodgrassella alvi]
MNELQYKKFKDININDPFFDSLKQSYSEFNHWFARKGEEFAYIFIPDGSNQIDGFLYLKSEPKLIHETTPHLIADGDHWLKVGTFKINAHGTKLGERFIKKIFDTAIALNIKDIYVTIFKEHNQLIQLFEKYGFKIEAEKTTNNGTELVLCRRISRLSTKVNDFLKDYPVIKFNFEDYAPKPYLLGIKPVWHTRLLPDSILKTEKASILQDISPTNSIHKVYLCSMRNVDSLHKGDILFIYRTTDEEGLARYRSVITSICVVEEYRNINTFENIDSFMKYCSPYSIFTEEELRDYWLRRKFIHIIRFSYNVALPRRVNRDSLINNAGLLESDYWGFMPLTESQANKIAELGGLNYECSDVYKTGIR